ncbi:hypothetical protein [Streptomyces sp. NPDC094049]|uniref:hypothetical protein n=1 Tax=Streptomyces sp. NPDC094049 TaxID=3154987 RepID=UPI0033300190
MQPFIPQQLPAIPPGATVAYTADGQPIYLPAQHHGPAPIVVQMPAQPVPAWLRNGLLAAVGLVIICTPATVLLVVAAPAVAALGQALAYGGIGIAVASIAVAAGIKALRETPAPAKPARTGLLGRKGGEK